MKLEVITKEEYDQKHDVSKNKLLNQKIEYNETEFDQSQQYIFTSQQMPKSHPQKIDLQLQQINECQNQIIAKNNQQLHLQKQVCIRDNLKEPLPQNIYLMRDYLSKFNLEQHQTMLLDKYQSKYKITPSTRSSKKQPELMNFLLLKSINFTQDKKYEHSQILDFMDKYKLRRLQGAQNERLIKNSQYNNDFSRPQSQSGQVFTNQWAAEIIKIPDVASNDLLALVSKQFFLFITSNYKILKQSFNEQLSADSNNKTQQNQINENEETQSYIQSLITKNSNFIEEFKNFKMILENQKIKGKQFEDEEQSQQNERYEKNQINQCLNQNCVNKLDNEQKEIGLSQINKQFSQISDYYPFKNNKNIIKKDQKQSQNNKNQFFELNENSYEDDQGQEKFIHVIDDEDLNQQIQQNKRNNNHIQFNKKKRTNNFYNLPRYFMMLILELLSEENLKELGLQDGFVQILSRISQNLMQQGKKSEKAKSKFYNHQHYNCIFLILKDEQSKKQHYSKQIEELYKKVYSVNNIYCQFNITYINCFKTIISQIIKFQLSVMQDLQLTQYILENQSLYPFEKSKINYISRVIDGIDKLNAGLNIHRF